MTTTPAGWYPDPYGSPDLRWWDGSQWTDATHAPVEPPPGPLTQQPAQPGAPTPPSPQPGPSGQPGPPGQAPDWHSPTAPQPGVQPPWGGPEHTMPLPGPGFGPPPRRTVVWPWVVGGVAVLVVLVVLALVVGGAVLHVNRWSAIVATSETAAPGPLDSIVPDTPTFPADPPPFGPQASPLPELPVPSDGRITDPVTGLSYYYPGDPWEVPKAFEINNPADPKAPLWTSGYQALSHGNYDGQQGNWVASVYAGLPAEAADYSGPQDLRPITEMVLKAYEPVFYSLPHTTKVLRNEATEVSGHQAWVIEFELDFTKVAKANGWKWRTEKAALVLVDRGPGQRPAMLYASIPDNLDQSVLNRVLNSLEAR